MTLFLAEIIDKIGCGYEPALGSFVLVLVLSALAGPWRWWLPAVLGAPIAIWVSCGILMEIQEPWGQQIIAEVGKDHYIREMVSWNAPFLLALPIGRLINRLAPAIQKCEEGLCPKCGYDLRGQLAAGCPECGWGRAPDKLKP